MQKETKSRPWPYAPPLPPKWVISAFDDMGETNSAVARNLAAQITRFNNIVVPELEKALQGSLNDPAAPGSVSADAQRCLFFKLAIEDAIAFRIRTERITRGKARTVSDIADRKRLRGQIAKKVLSLSKSVGEYKVISDRLNDQDLDCDPFRLIVALDKLQREEKEGALGYLDGFSEEKRKQFEVLLQYFDWIGGGIEHLQAMLAVLHKNASTEDRVSLLTLEEKLGIHSRKSSGHFIEALLSHVHQNSFECGGFFPENFDLPTKAKIVMESALMGTEEQSNEAVYMRSTRKSKAPPAPALSEAWKSVDPRLIDDDLLRAIHDGNVTRARSQ